MTNASVEKRKRKRKKHQNTDHTLKLTINKKHRGIRVFTKTTKKT